MPRKTIVTVILILLIVIFGGLFGFYSYLNKQNAPADQAMNTPAGFSNFPSSPSTPAENTQANNTNTANNQPSALDSLATTTEEVIPLLRQISKNPVAGSTVFDRVLSTTTVATTTNGIRKTKTISIIKSIIRYIDRATGNVFETATSSLAISRISNTTFAKIYNATFDSTGENLIMQTLPNESGESITSYYGQLRKPFATSTEETLNVIALSNSISFFAQSPSKNSVFSLLSNLSGTQGVIFNMDGTGTKGSTVWSSPLHDWLTSWPSQNTILLQTKPSANVVGYSYLLNPQTGAFTKYLGYINGLTVNASPDTHLALAGQSDLQNNSLSLGLYRTSEHSIQTMFLKTLPEKCTWGQKDPTYIYCAVPTFIPPARYPDDWYQGKIAFSDSIWKVNIITGDALRVGALSNLGRQDFDAINLTLDNNDDYLIFTNKRDLSLWGLKLPQ